MEFQYLDLRAEVMSGLGADADRLSFEHLKLEIKTRAQQGPLVVQNIEALLAARTVEQRCGWYKEIQKVHFENRVYFPLCLYAEEVGEQNAHLYSFKVSSLPERSLLMALYENKGS